MKDEYNNKPPDDVYIHRSKGKWKNKYSRISGARQTTISRRIEKKVTPDKSKTSESKAIMILCPSCGKTHVISGRPRREYLKKVARKEYDFGKPCSKECQKLLADPTFRKTKAKVVWMHYRDVSDAAIRRAMRKKGNKGAGRPRLEDEKPLMVESLITKRKRDEALVD